MTVHGHELNRVTGTRRSAAELDVRSRVRDVARSGATWTLVLMVLPGLLSSRPVENCLTGAALGLSATLVTACGVYAWRSYLVPYRRVRRLVRRDLGASSTSGRLHRV